MASMPTSLSGFDPGAISQGSVALALAFLNLGPERPGDPDSPLIPGRANEQIAQTLEELSSRLAFVLTQKAVSDALTDPHRLRDGPPVFQMHRHCQVEVRTFAALRCALDRLPEGGPASLVLIAHADQMPRARIALEALAGPAKLTCVSPSPVEYLHAGQGRPFSWRVKNTVAGVADRLLAGSRTSRTCRCVRCLCHPLLSAMSVRDDCPGCVRLGKLRLVGGAWTETGDASA
jgi:hypothetical protein